MSPVFAHGQMRLYLLALLDEGPRHGYEVMRALEERFNGLYSPSAGTVYPRLAKLEEEGLVERVDEGRKATYRITDAGRAEVRARAYDVADLQQDLDHSVRELAEQVRTRVHTSASDLRAELREAARQARASAKPVPGRGSAWDRATDPVGPPMDTPLQDRAGWSPHHHHGAPYAASQDHQDGEQHVPRGPQAGQQPWGNWQTWRNDPGVRDLEAAVNAFRFEVRDAVRGLRHDPARRQEVMDILGEAAERLREVLRRP